MSFTATEPPQTRFLYMDTLCLAAALHNACLAAWPYAANAEDPYVYHGQEEQEEIPLLFSDILDSSFREPRDIIHMSNLAQGVKS